MVQLTLNQFVKQFKRNHSTSKRHFMKLAIIVIEIVLCYGMYVHTSYGQESDAKSEGKNDLIKIIEPEVKKFLEEHGATQEQTKQILERINGLPAQPNTVPKVTIPSYPPVAPNYPRSDLDTKPDLMQTISQPNRMPGYLTRLDEIAKNDSEVEKELKAWLIAWIRWEKGKFDDIKNTITTTNRNGNIIFWAMHLLLIVSVIITGIEFWNSSRIRKLGKKSGLPPEEQHELALEAAKVSLKTSSYGILLLCCFLVIYFLYLKFVYPLTVVSF
jgi:hypothetical protein